MTQTPGGYDCSLDTYAFGVCLWELLTSALPYQKLRTIQTCILVSKFGERPPIPDGCPPLYAHLMRGCWEGDRSKRLEISYVRMQLESGEANIAGTDAREFAR
jgi:serine/threonine protein kinase